MKKSTSYTALAAFFAQAAVIDLATYATRHKRRFLLYTALNLGAGATFGALAIKEKILPQKEVEEVEDLDEITETVKQTAAEALVH